MLAGAPGRTDEGLRRAARPGGCGSRASRPQPRSQSARVRSGPGGWPAGSVHGQGSGPPRAGHTALPPGLSAEASSSPGLSADPALHPDLRAGGRGEAHHAGRAQPAAAAVGPAWLRVPLPHPGEPGPRHRPALQQLQPAVPELLGEVGRGLGAPRAGPSREPSWPQAPVPALSAKPAPRRACPARLRRHPGLPGSGPWPPAGPGVRARGPRVVMGQEPPRRLAGAHLRRGRGDLETRGGKRTRGFAWGPSDVGEVAGWVCGTPSAVLPGGPKPGRRRPGTQLLLCVLRPAPEGSQRLARCAPARGVALGPGSSHIRSLEPGRVKSQVQ